jgi:hypothetical protein
MESSSKRSIDLFRRGFRVVVSKRNSAQLLLHKPRESQEGGGTWLSQEEESVLLSRTHYKHL